MNGPEMVRTAHAALLVISVSGSFPDEADREEMARTAEQVQALPDLQALTGAQQDLVLEALLLAFRDGQQQGAPPGTGPLAGLLTPERLGLAYLTLAEQVDRQAGAEYDLQEACLASVALSLFRLDTLVMTDEVRVQRRELTALLDQLEALIHTASPLALSEAERYSLRQSVISSLHLLGTQPGLVDRLEAAPDLLAALTPDRLRAAYDHLTTLRDSAGQA